MSDTEYPVPGFNFRVTVGSNRAETSFSEVSGLTLEMEFEEVEEGGANGVRLRLPLRVKHPNLVLSRGILAKSSALYRWCHATLVDFRVPIETMLVHIHLLDATGAPVRAWTCSDAWPVKWEVTALNSEKNAVAVEKIELAYTQLDQNAGSP